MINVPNFFTTRLATSSVPIRNPNTRQAYYRAINQFLAWCDQAGFQELEDIEPRTFPYPILGFDIARESSGVLRPGFLYAMQVLDIPTASHINQKPLI